MTHPPPKAHVMYFGDGIDLSRELIRLVRSGAKTAAIGSLAEFEAWGDPLPLVGHYVIGTDSELTPKMVLRLTDVQVVPFDQVPDDFIAAEGEGASPEEWRDAHEVYFCRKGTFSPDMQVICFRFDLIGDVVPVGGQG